MQVITGLERPKRGLNFEADQEAGQLFFLIYSTAIYCSDHFSFLNFYTALATKHMIGYNNQVYFATFFVERIEPNERIP